MPLLTKPNTGGKMTPESINKEYKESVMRDPENASLYSEICRAKFCLYSNPGESPGKVLKNYMIQNQVVEMLVGEVPAHEPKKKRADKYDELVAWCKENHLLQVSAEDVAEKGEMSYPTALKFIKDRPDLFYKIKKGLYEVRNPEIVKQEENL